MLAILALANHKKRIAEHPPVSGQPSQSGHQPESALSQSGAPPGPKRPRPEQENPSHPRVPPPTSNLDLTAILNENPPPPSPPPRRSHLNLQYILNEPPSPPPALPPKTPRLRDRTPPPLLPPKRVRIEDMIN